jgi:type IV pilus assembly protein PilC
MFRNPEITWSALAGFSRSVGRMLESGVDVRKALKTASRQSTDGRLTAAVDEVSRSINHGRTMAEAFNEQSDRFPALFRDLVDVGEQTGATAEVFTSLAKYYESRVKQVREFRAAISFPVFQLFAAVMIIGLLIFILGILPARGPDGPIDVLGFGLLGPSGAMIWFLGCGASVAAGFIAWKMATRNLAGQTFLHPLMLNIPGIGSCMRSFAISRFSWCFALTQQAGMSIRPSLACSMKATANGAFMVAEPLIWDELQQGQTFGEALTASQLFPAEYLQFIHTAEESGTVPEQLARMSHLFDEEATRSLERLTKIFSAAVWIFVAGLIVFFIFRIALFYIGQLNSALDMAM